MDKLTISYAYISQRNQILSELADIQSKDHLLNISFDTGVGKLTSYAYILEEDNVPENSIDTFGLHFAGRYQSTDSLSFPYALEYATQDFDNGTVKRDADYMLGEFGADISGVKVMLGYKTLGSDDGNYGFQTPLATLHKFNRWADMFLGTPVKGLVDTYLTVSSSVAGANVSLTYHIFEADDEGSSNVEDFGHEFDIAVTKKFGKHYNGGIKYAAYSAGDTLVDTDKNVGMVRRFILI